MPHYGRDFSRSRYDEERQPDRGFRGRGEFGGGYEGFGGRYGMRSEGPRYGGFNEDAVDEMSGMSGGSYDDDFDAGFRGDRYGGSGMGGYMAGGWGRGFDNREERDFGGYERGYTGGGRGSYGGGRSQGGSGGGRGFGRESLGDRGYESFGGYGGSTGSHRGGNGDELRRLRAADIMTENPECVTPEVSLADAARKMRDLDVGIIPVVESEGNRRLRGVITDRDIAIRAVADGRDANNTRVSEVMTTDVETCNKNDPVQNVLRLMEREQVRRVPITDREGRLVGIIAQADVATELDEDRSEHRVANTLERISEPGGRGSSGGMRAGAGRSGSAPSRGRSSMGGTSSGMGSQGQTDLQGGSSGTTGGENL
jgi:CBS domain-containing protein